MRKVAQIDIDLHKALRNNIKNFMIDCAKKYDKEGMLLLDIAPQDHEGSLPYFKKSKVETLDIDDESGATYIADICLPNQKIIPTSHFDYVVCTEVLEHTLQPFDAVKEIERILKPGGMVFVSTPFNFRIHGPLPDCWRFTEHGLKELFKNYEIISIKELETKGRFLMPTQYTLIAKNK